MGGIIKEVMLENFMSYRYARVPLSEGVNLIVGPNGSGKSTILLAISVALGQTYTERGRKLSDLIRRGQHFSRVTVVIDNSPSNGGGRPLPFKSEEVYISRYIREDGQYWHEVNGRAGSKAQVKSYLRRIGLDPDNLLIVMHQNMVEELAYLPPQKRLLLVEEAVGMGQYRLKISEAMRELEIAVSEEEKAKELLERADYTMRYWEEMYSKFLRSEELKKKLRELRIELAWAQVAEKEAKAEEIKRKIEEVDEGIRNVEGSLNELKEKERNLMEEIDSLEREVLEKRELEQGLRVLRDRWMEYASSLAERRVEEFRLDLFRSERADLVRELERAERKVREALEEARELGERVKTRSIEEIEEEMREVELSIAALGKIPPRVKEAYSKYREIYSQLKERADQVMENRRRLGEELKRRKELWRKKVEEVIGEVNELYREFISRLGGEGEVRLVNVDDLEGAGLEIYSDFTGLGLIPLDPYRHSGGERSVTVMCFFLALQKYVRSPFRAVDEFDVHMDPRNREEILRIIFELAKEGGQHVVITPAPPSWVPEGANVIVVQKIKGTSAAGGAT